jgi:CheY-like chemotaxis protein/tetratricopeptide (TPR) repeat protein
MKLKIENDSTSNLMDTQDLSSEVQSANGSAEVTEMLRSGIKAAQEGNRSDARHFLMQATELEPKNENAWLWLASISEYPEELLIFLNNVLRVNPKNERALEWEKSTKSLLSKTFVKRGIEASKESQIAIAKQSFLQAIVHDDKNEMAWLWLASISESVDDKKSHLQKVLKINPENETASNLLNTLKQNLAMEQLRQAQVDAVAGNTEASKKLLADVLKNAPEFEDAWLLKCYLTDSFSKKMEYLQKVHEINAENENAVVGLAAMKSLVECTEPKPDSTVTSFEIEVPEALLADVEVETESAELLQEVAAELTEEFTSPDELSVEESAIIPTQNYDFEVATSKEVEPVDVLNFESPQQLEEIEEFVQMVSNVSEDDIDEESEMDYAFQETVSEEPVYQPEAIEEDLPVSVMPSYHEDVEEAQTFEHQMEAEAQPAEVADESGFENGVDHEAVESTVNAAEMESEPISMPEEVLELHDNVPEKTKAEMVSCPFCSAENELHGFICHSCRAMMTMTDVDLMLAHADSDLVLVQQRVDQLEAKFAENKIDAEGLKVLGIGLLNLKNLPKSFEYLQEASLLEPNDVVLSSHVNSLAIRLSEIDGQKNLEVSMPKNKTILVVDDSATVRKLVSGKLEKCGLEVICAVDGMDALEKINESIPDLILLDITMPRMDGYQVCKMIRGNEATKDVPVVMISGKDGFFDKVRGRMAGTTGYITKPFGPETLMKTVEAYIE